MRKSARLLKIHPPTQGVDLIEKKHARFFRRCADLKMVVMVHTGHEHAAPIFSIELADPRKLELALDVGCTVVACHCGTGRQQDRPDMLPGFLAMVRSPRICGAIRRFWAAGSAIFSVCLPIRRQRNDCCMAATFPFPPFRWTLRGPSG